MEQILKKGTLQFDSLLQKLIKYKMISNCIISLQWQELLDSNTVKYYYSLLGKMVKWFYYVGLEEGW